MKNVKHLSFEDRSPEWQEAYQSYCAVLARKFERAKTKWADLAREGFQFKIKERTFNVKLPEDVTDSDVEDVLKVCHARLRNTYDLYASVRAEIARVEIWILQQLGIAVFNFRLQSNPDYQEYSNLLKSEFKGKDSDWERMARNGFSIKFGGARLRCRLPFNARPDDVRCALADCYSRLQEKWYLYDPRRAEDGGIQGWITYNLGWAIIDVRDGIVDQERRGLYVPMHQVDPSTGEVMTEESKPVAEEATIKHKETEEAKEKGEEDQFILAWLPAKQAELIRLHEKDGYKQKEIAKMKGKTPASINKQFERDCRPWRRTVKYYWNIFRTADPRVREEIGKRLLKNKLRLTLLDADPERLDDEKRRSAIKIMREWIWNHPPAWFAVWSNRYQSRDAAAEYTIAEVAPKTQAALENFIPEIFKPELHGHEEPVPLPTVDVRALLEAVFLQGLSCNDAIEATTQMHGRSEPSVKLWLYDALLFGICMNLNASRLSN